MTDEFKPLIVEGEEVGEYNDTTFSFDKYQMATVELWTSPREFDAYQYDWDAFKEFYKPDNEDEMYAECEDEDFTPGMNGIDTIDIEKWLLELKSLRSVKQRFNLVLVTNDDFCFGGLCCSGQFSSGQAESWDIK